MNFNTENILENKRILEALDIKIPVSNKDVNKYYITIPKIIWRNPIYNFLVDLVKIGIVSDTYDYWKNVFLPIILDSSQYVKSIKKCSSYYWKQIKSLLNQSNVHKFYTNSLIDSSTKNLDNIDNRFKQIKIAKKIAKTLEIRIYLIYLNTFILNNDPPDEIVNSFIVGKHCYIYPTVEGIYTLIVARLNDYISSIKFEILNGCHTFLDEFTTDYWVNYLSEYYNTSSKVSLLSYGIINLIVAYEDIYWSKKKTSERKEIDEIQLKNVTISRSQTYENLSDLFNEESDVYEKHDENGLDNDYLDYSVLEPISNHKSNSFRSRHPYLNGLNSLTSSIENISIHLLSKKEIEDIYDCNDSNNLIYAKLLLLLLSYKDRLLDIKYSTYEKESTNLSPKTERRLKKYHDLSKRIYKESTNEIIQLLLLLTRFSIEL